MLTAGRITQEIQSRNIGLSCPSSGPRNLKIWWTSRTTQCWSQSQDLHIQPISSASCQSNLVNILLRRMKGIGKIATTKLLLCSTTSKTNTFLKSDGSVIRISNRSRIKSAYSGTWTKASIFMMLISLKEGPGGFGRRLFSPLCRLLLRKDFTGAGNKTYSESCTNSLYYCQRN